MNLRMEGNGHNGRMTAFLIGSMAGGVAALLLAPTSGRRLRRSLNRNGRRLKRRASDSVANLRDRGEEAIDRASETLDALADDARKVARYWGAH
jgi:gas vesicle protein